MKSREIGLIIYTFFLLILVQVALMYFKEEISIITILEAASFGLVIVIYYFIVSAEVKIAAKTIEDRLMKVEKSFERVEKRFNEEVKILKKEVSELKTLLQKTPKK